MKIQIRCGVFETNSSSTHSIAISGKELNNIPKTLKFKFGKFGWNEDIFTDVYNKASYIWTYVFNKYVDLIYPKKDGRTNYDAPPLKSFNEKYIKWKTLLTEVCKEVGVENIIFEEELRKSRFDRSGYIDHSSELDDFIDNLAKNKELLKCFLFCDDSEIITGNDNDGSNLDSTCEKPIFTYYKGN